MTDPVILLGTQSNGETLPVQVDGFGRLVAEGLQGSEGPPGPEGPAGGTFPLPADPYEGALLGWLNGELSWIGSPPVPIPPGVFGPITEWDVQSGVLTVEGEIPAEVGNGVYVWQCNEDGTYFTEGWNTSQVWSDRASSDPADPQGIVFTRLFDGSTSTGIAYNLLFGTTQIQFDPLIYGDKIEIFADNVEPGWGIDVLNGATIETPGWNDTGVTLLSQFSLSTGQGKPQQIARAIRVDGKILADTDLSLNLRVSGVGGQSLLGVPSATVDFTIGKYLRVPEQRVAPWVLYGNDPTSLIDHLRSS